jgi:hypothetical protein
MYINSVLKRKPVSYKVCTYGNSSGELACRSSNKISAITVRYEAKLESVDEF